MPSAALSGSWKVCSLSDGYVDLPAELLRDPDNKIWKQTESAQRDASLVRLSVNCFLFDRSGIDRILIDCGGGGSWGPSMGHLEEERRERPASTRHQSRWSFSPMLMATTSMVFSRLTGDEHQQSEQDRDWGGRRRGVSSRAQTRGVSSTSRPNSRRRPASRSFAGRGDTWACSGPYGLSPQHWRGRYLILRRPDPRSCGTVCPSRAYLGL